MLLQKKYKIPIIIKIVGVVIFIVYILPFLQEIVANRQENMGGDLSSGRIDRWKDCLKYLHADTSRYLTGVGGGTVPISDFNFHIRLFASPHNAFIGFLFEYGIIALLLFVFFLIGKIKKLKQIKSPGVVILIGSLIVCWNSEVVTLAFQYSFFFWLLYFVLYKSQSLRSQGVSN